MTHPEFVTRHAHNRREPFRLGRDLHLARRWGGVVEALGQRAHAVVWFPSAPHQPGYTQNVTEREISVFSTILQDRLTHVWMDSAPGCGPSRASSATDRQGLCAENTRPKGGGSGNGWRPMADVTISRSINGVADGEVIEA
jgi:hypothetical protein